MKKQTKRLLLLIDLLFICALIVGIFLFQKAARQKDAMMISQEERDRRYVPSIVYQGQSCPLKRNLSSVLLIGTDSIADVEKQSYQEGEFHSDDLADFLVILVFDHANKTVTPFQICRDTMCEITRVNILGEPLPSKIMQITLSYTYGSGKEDSCINTRNCVENLLFQVPIDNYFSFTMDVVPLLNDLVGGVTVTLENDIPALGKNYVKGAAITLKGREALRFVRHRDTALIDSNVARMANHRLYIDSFTKAAREAYGKDPDIAARAIKMMGSFLCTDMPVDRISAMVDDLNQYTILPFVYPDGEYAHKENERWPGFYVDEASLWSCVKSTFCQ